MSFDVDWTSLPSAALATVAHRFSGVAEVMALRLACRAFAGVVPAPRLEHAAVSGVAERPLPASARSTLMTLDVHVPDGGSALGRFPHLDAPELAAALDAALSSHRGFLADPGRTLSLWLQDFAVAEHVVRDAFLAASVTAVGAGRVEVTAGWMSLDGSLGDVLSSASNVAAWGHACVGRALEHMETSVRPSPGDASRFPQLRSLRVTVTGSLPSAASVRHVAKLVIEVRGCDGRRYTRRDPRHVAEALCGRYCAGETTRHVCVSVPWDDGALLPRTSWTQAGWQWSFAEATMCPPRRRAAFCADRLPPRA